MTFTHVLVDRARTIARAPTPYKAGGETKFTEVASPWFKARLMPAASAESGGGEDGIGRVVDRPTLLYEPKDLQGNLLHVTVEDRIEVDSREFGVETFQLVGDPEALRESRRIIGYQVVMRRIEEHAEAAALGVLHPVGKSLKLAWDVHGVTTVGRTLQLPWKVGV